MNCYVYVIVRQCILYCISFEKKIGLYYFLLPYNGSNNIIMVAGSGHLQRSQSFTQCGGQSLPPCSS